MIINFLFFYHIKSSDAILESMTRYVSPINPAIYPQLTILLLGIGLFFTAWFIVYDFCFKIKKIM